MIKAPALKLLAAAVAVAVPFAAAAHRGWLLPSATVLSGNEPWVTVDAAVSNDLFYFEHQPLRLEGLVVTAPDGTAAKAENQNTGRYRSTFDVKLSRQGTYKIAMVNVAVMASYKVGSETKRLRGTAESLAREIPANAENLSVTQSITRNEIFVTLGKPTQDVLKPTNRGLELVPVTHPNDLVVGETATFGFLLDGQPAAALPVTVIPGGIRYRDQLGEQKLVTDAKGEVRIKWSAPGMYWLNAAPGRPGEPGGPAGTLAQPVRRASYTTTLEVLAP